MSDLMGALIGRDLNDVLIFTKVVQAGSFTAAAKDLGVPNSTVSRRVSRLEGALGVRLLQRTTRKLSVTEAGALYFERGVSALASLEEAENILAEAQSTPRGRVRVLAPVEQSITVQLVTDFLALFPDVRVDLEFTSREVNIIQEGYDVAIGPGPITNLSVASHKLMDSPFQIVGSPKYLKHHGEPRRISDLARHECIVFGPNSASGHWTLGAKTKTTRVPVRGRISVNHMQAARQAALAGLGLALLPKLVCSQDLHERKLKSVLTRSSPAAVPIYVTFAAGRFLAPAVRAFVEYARKEFRILAEPSKHKRKSSASRR